MEAAAVLPEVLTLVAGELQLADRGGGGGDDAGRKRGGEDVGAADQPKHPELGMVGDDEAPDRPHRLGEGTDDEIDLVLDPGFLEHAAAVGAEEAHPVSLVHHDHRSVAPGDLDHLLQGAMSPSIE